MKKKTMNHLTRRTELRMRRPRAKTRRRRRRKVIEVI